MSSRYVLVLSLIFSGAVALLLPALTSQSVHADVIATLPTSRAQITATISASRVHRLRVPPQQPVVSPAPVPTPTPTPTPAPVSPPITPPASSTPPLPPTESPTTFATQLEDEIFARINVERVKNGRAQLIHDTKLAALARAHSADMLANKYFSHTSVSGCTVACRFANAGYSYWSYGENIYWMSGYTLTAGEAAEKVVNGWMNSSGHRANILNGTFTNQGIGVAISGKTMYVTQDLSKPR